MDSNSKEKVTSNKSKAAAANVINPSTDKGNYLIQVITNGNVIKNVVALGSTVNIINLADNPAAFDVR